MLAARYLGEPPQRAVGEGASVVAVNGEMLIGLERPGGSLAHRLPRAWGG